MTQLAPTLESVLRDERSRILAAVIRVLGGDFAAAEEVVQDAMLAAWTSWPEDGIPAQPRAWLIRVARNRAVDHVRRCRSWASKEEALGELAHLEEQLASPPEGAEWHASVDDQLRLLFTCCHPALALDARVSLALRTLAGLTTEEIARAFLVPVPTMAQRLVRAKSKIAAAGIPYRVPEQYELPSRLAGVLQVVYLIFSEGYAATSGPRLVRTDLCSEAIRLGRLLVELLPDQPEARALLALMLLHHSRRHTRLAGDHLVLLHQQDRRRWDGAAIDEGLALLDRALELGAHGPYCIEAAIAALHARASSAEQTDWPQIAALYDRLGQVAPSDITELNGAVAHAMAGGPKDGLRRLFALTRAGRLKGYYLLPAALADLLRRVGRAEEAATYYREALSLVRTEAERSFLERRLEELGAV